MDYNNKCDMALPLEQLLKPNPATRRLLERIDRSRFRVMGLTNAYKSVRVASSISRLGASEGAHVGGVCIDSTL